MYEKVIEEIRDAVQAMRDVKWKQCKTWEDVGNAAGVMAHTIMNWNGRQGPNLKKLLPVLDALGLEMVIREKQ